MNDNAVQDFVKALKDDTQEPSKTYGAYVSHVDDEGVVWVRIAGAETETPTASRSAEVKPNDYVNVEWRNNKLYIAGNTSNPSAGVSRVLNVEAAAATAQDAANSAVVDAGRAREAADEARATANSVHDIAVEAQTDAGIAKASAANASEYAARALGNLSTVQSVTETLNWITAHGTMTLTTDTALDPTHVYFVRDVDGDYEVGEYTYSVVTEPDVRYISTYYVLSIDESLNNYVGTHLSLTAEGLYVMLDGTSYKVLVGQSVKILNPSGEVISEYGTSATIGQTSGQHIQIGTDSIVFYSAENANAYVAQDKFYSTNAEVSDAFYIGDYSLRTDADSKFVIGRRR